MKTFSGRAFRAIVLLLATHLYLPAFGTECAIELAQGAFEYALTLPRENKTSVQVEKHPDGSYLILATEIDMEPDKRPTAVLGWSPRQRKITCSVHRFEPRGPAGGFTVETLEITDRHGHFETIGPTFEISAEAPHCKELLKERRRMAQALKLHQTTVWEIGRAQRILWRKFTGLDWDLEDKLTQAIAIATSHRLLVTVSEGINALDLSLANVESHLRGESLLIISFVDDEDGDVGRRYVELTHALQFMRQHHFAKEADALASAIVRRLHDNRLLIPQLP